MKLVITLDGVVEVTEATGDWFAPAGGDTDTADLELVDTRQFRSGIVLLTYRPTAVR